jgi:transposase
VIEKGYRMRGEVLSTLCIALAILGCSRSDSAQGVADRFVQAYYVQIDQAQALEYTSGLARERLHQELQRVASLRRGSSLEQARPNVSYTLARTQSEGGQILLVYDLTITPPQVKPILKKILIIMEPLGEQWKVINFTETDAHP